MAGPLVDSGCVRIEGDRIAEVGTDASISYEGETVVDWSRLVGPDRYAVIMPGLIDCHCHLELSGLAGRIKCRKGQGLIQWLMKIFLYRPKRRSTHARWVKMGVSRCLAGGTTTVADISANNWSWRTLVDEPIRKICVAEVLGFGAKAAGAMEGLAERMEAMPGETELFLKGISPHAPYSTSKSVYQSAMSLADREGWRVMTHLAEDGAELEFIRTGKGPWRMILQGLGAWERGFCGGWATPVEWAKSVGVLDRPVLLAHVNYVSDGDISLLAGGGATVVYCPLAHWYFHHAPHRYRDMIAAGVNVALGSDSLACSSSLSMLDQMRDVYEAGGLDPEAIIGMATVNASKSLRLESLIGTLEGGKLADLIVVSIDRKFGDDLTRGVLDRDVKVEAVMIGGQNIRISGKRGLVRE